MDRVGVGPVKGLRIAIAAFVLSLALLLAVGGVTVLVLTQKTATTADFSRELRNGLVKNCEATGNPTREAVQGLLEEQIRNSESPLIRELFPTLPQTFIDERIAALRDRLAEVAPVNCSALYPRP